ncbi:hypothetical protein RHGRI_004103 [Rhododendron griersonianum]|uniref:Trigger factor ribosome-binding bacterial domain-containing protein n=1 Tax=Rhododendron griersonianum TaxID=479676 RepID=A0AAV6L9B2_9ERIC|nr:hypothetical protein RHGRI_004103 [Rhododendron griersonianum]
MATIPMMSQFHCSNVAFRSLQKHVQLETSRNATRINLCSAQHDAHGRLINICTSSRRSLKRLKPKSAAGSGVEVSTDPKDNAITISTAKIMVESEDFDNIQLRVDLAGKDTQRVFDQVLKNLARSAPPFPGLRKLKGGEPSNLLPVLLNFSLIKYRCFAGGPVPESNTCRTPILSKQLFFRVYFSSEILITGNPVPFPFIRLTGMSLQIPKSFLFDVFGKDSVTEFVVNEIVTSTMCDYVKKASHCYFSEKLKVKDSKVNTVQTAEELKSSFAPGKEFGFNVTLELENFLS